MSQFNIRNIREISNDPLTKFTNELAKKLSKFLTQNQLDQLEDKEDIYSDGQDLESVIKYHSFNSQNQFNFTTEYYPPTEPDGEFVTLWLRGHNMGNTVKDISGFANHGDLIGDPLLVDGTPFDYGIKTQGIKSVALRMNRPTSENENQEYISVSNDSSLQIAGLVTGISYFIRFKIFDIAQQGVSRTLFEKVDDSTPNDGIVVKVGPTGKLIVVLRDSGTEVKKETASSTITTNTVYEVFITYAVSGNAIKVYINNVDTTLSNSSDSSNFHSTLTDHSLSIFRRGLGSQGYVYGDLYDFLIYREKVVSSTEVGHHYTNKWTIADIPYGQVAVTNYYATFLESVQTVSSFSSTSFSSTSFTT